MGKTKIYNQYAIEQGYESWRELTEDYAINGNILTYKYLDHQNAVTDLIQEELKKKIADRFNGGFERCRINETEII